MGDLHRHLTKLDDPNKVERRRHLDHIKSIIDSNDDKVLLAQLWKEKLCLPLLKLLKDPSERVRETSAQIILVLLGHSANDTLNSSYVLAALKSRLAAPDDQVCVESSEEVRVLLLKILQQVMGKNDVVEAKAHLTDTVDILKTCIVDPFADARVLACQIVLVLAETLPKDFHLNASSLLPPLVKAMGHQQKKVRIASIKGIGCVIKHCGFEEFKMVASHLAQRLFDPMSQVRLAVSVVAADLLLNWRCAAASCTLLVPLLLTTLEDDECPENKREASELWSKVGLAWIEDEATRDDRMKEQMDFLGGQDKPSHYPADVDRPHYGCRQFVTRILTKLLPALSNDLRDWLEETRVKASQLTFVLMCHLEDTAVCTQHADEFLSIMYQGVKDNEAKVGRNMCRTAFVYGHFVPPKTWCPLVSQRLLSQPSDTDLMITGHIINGSDPELLKYCLEDLVLVLQDDSICLTMNDSFLEDLLECVSAMLRVCGKQCEHIQSHLFKVGITVEALAQSDELKTTAKAFLDTLASTNEMSTGDLFKHEMGTQLKSMRSECSNWGASSYRIQVFSTLLSHGGSVVGYYPDLIVNIFSGVLTAKEIEPELQLKMYMVLSRQLYDTQNTLDSQKQFQQFALRVVRDLVMPALTWHAGRKAEAVRIAATSSLWSVFESKCLTTEDIVDKLAATLIPSMNRLLEDDSVKIRLFICRAYQRIFEQCGRALPPDYLVKICSELMKRLDDVNDEVRLACLSSVAAVTSCLPEEGSREMQNHLQGVFATLLLHMDDSSEQIRNAALETLMKTGKKCPKLLMEMTKKAADKHSHREQCAQLIEHLKALKV